MATNEHDPLSGWVERSPQELRERAEGFYHRMRTRRSVRDFSPQPVPDEVIELCLRTAGTAPSGANRQPWHFVVVRDPARKRQLREATEREEREFYERRAPQEWLDALGPFGTNAHKPFLETAPCIIAIFAEAYGVGRGGERQKNYYVKESVGIATGLLIAALHTAGLATLTQTPSQMGFLNELLGRPDNERPFLLLVTGYPATGARVPRLERRTLTEIADFL